MHHFLFTSSRQHSRILNRILRSRNKSTFTALYKYKALLVFEYRWSLHIIHVWLLKNSLNVKNYYCNTNYKIHTYLAARILKENTTVPTVIQTAATISKQNLG